MENSISRQNVNVNVRAVVTDPNVTVQYKTKVLQKNVVSGVNTLTPAMISEANTKYIIKYDYTLPDDITIPENCILEFDGGSISGEHTITGQNTGIEAGLVKILSTDVTLAGTWSVEGFYAEWFGAKGDNSTDNGTIINAVVNNIPVLSTIIFGTGTFLTSTTLVFDTVNVRLQRATVIKATANMPVLVKLFRTRQGIEAFDAQGLFLEGGVVNGGNYADIVVGGDYIVGVVVKDVRVLGGVNYGINLHSEPNHFGYADIRDCYLEHITGAINSSVGIYAGTDDSITNCQIRDYHVGVDAHAASKLHVVHVWLSPNCATDLYNNSVGFNIIDSDCELTECVADTYEVGFWIKTGGCLRGTNLTYMSANTPQRDNYIFSCQTRDSYIKVVNMYISNNANIHGFKDGIKPSDTNTRSYCLCDPICNNNDLKEELRVLNVNLSELSKSGNYNSFSNTSTLVRLAIVRARGANLLFHLASGGNNASDNVSGLLVVNTGGGTIKYKKVTWFTEYTANLYYKHEGNDVYSIAIERVPYQMVNCLCVGLAEAVLDEVDISEYTQMTF